MIICNKNKQQYENQTIISDARLALKNVELSCRQFDNSTIGGLKGEKYSKRKIYNLTILNYII